MKAGSWLLRMCVERPCWLCVKPILLSGATLVSCLWLWSSHAEERLWVPAKINGKPARLGFDTGASDVILFRAGAQRLNLKFTAPQTNAVLAPGQVPLGETEECTLKLWGMKVRTRFGVVDLPDYLHPTNFDGLIGWGPISRNIVQIDAVELKITFLRDLPKDVSNWTKLQLRADSPILLLETSSGDKTPQILEVDTGDDRGIALAPQKWAEWKTAHPLRPQTLTAFFTPGSGIVVAEEAWAEQLLLGPLILTDVPVSEAAPTQAAFGSPQFVATLGLAALKRLDFVVDGRHGMAYLRCKMTPPSAYEHNRAGVVFVPADSHGPRLVARVLENSPAYEAGVRNEDILLSIDGSDYSHLRAGADLHPNQAFHERPAGSKVTLTLKRDSQTFQATVTLRQILGPEHTKL